MSDFGTILADVAAMHKGFFGQTVTYSFADASTAALTAIVSVADTAGIVSPSEESTRGRVVLRLALADLGGKAITPSDDTVLIGATSYVVVDYASVDGATVEITAERRDRTGFGFRGREI